MAAIFTVDWEDWFDSLHIEGYSKIAEPTYYLLDALDKYGVRAIFYILGITESREGDLVDEIFSRGHVLMSHGYYHYPYEDADRKPYANMGMTGGFWFRALPINILKHEINRLGNFYIHPHDIMLYHPTLKNPVLNLKRKFGLDGARGKLETLLGEVEWHEPSKN
jgi:hypothetical protein